jgi:hypothetical protein
VVEACGRGACLSHGGWEAKRERKEEPRDKIVLRALHQESTSSN